MFNKVCRGHDSHKASRYQATTSANINKQTQHTVVSLSHRSTGLASIQILRGSRDHETAFG